MKIVEIGRDNAVLLFNYWNQIGKGIPYFYNTSYQEFLNSLFEDTFDGMTIFVKNKVFIAIEEGSVMGFIQYGIPTFHFTKTGKITKYVNIGIIRNLYYEISSPNVGKKLLDLSLNFFKDNNIKDIYGFYHAMGMSCNGNHGKLHERFNYIDELLLENRFEIEHENIYYICDMKERKFEYPDNNHIKIFRLDSNRQRFKLYDEKDNELGSAEIKYIDNVTGLSERDIIYLVWIGVNNKAIGKGIGTNFLKHIIRYCLDKGYRYLHTDTALNNTRAQRFYIRNGFIDNGKTKSYQIERDS